MAARDERERALGIDVGRRENLLERHRLHMVVPPAERIVHVHDGPAARDAGVQPPHDGGHERAIGALQHDADTLTRQRRVAQRGIEQLAVEQIADDQVVGALAERSRRRLARRRQITARGLRHELVGDARRDVLAQHLDATPQVGRQPPARTPCRASVEIDQVDAQRALRQSAQRHIVPVAGANDGNAGARAEMPIEHGPERIASGLPALQALGRGARIALRIGPRGRPGSVQQRTHRAEGNPLCAACTTGV